MPLYQVKCEECQLEQESFSSIAARREIKCSECGSETNIVITPGQFYPFRKAWFKDIGPEPIFIESKGQLRKECKKHGAYSDYLDDPC